MVRDVPGAERLARAYPDAALEVCLPLVRVGGVGAVRQDRDGEAGRHE